MKTLATSTYLKFGALVAALSAIAASGGYVKVYSDETLKREVEPLESSLDRLRRLLRRELISDKSFLYRFPHGEVTAEKGRSDHEPTAMGRSAY